MDSDATGPDRQAPGPPQEGLDARRRAVADAAGLGESHGGSEPQEAAQRTVLDEFEDTLVNALAQELDMLRAPRDQWRLVARGVVKKMHVRGVPSTLMFSSTALAKQCVVFDLQGERDIPEVPTLPPSLSVEEQTPVVTVDQVGLHEGYREEVMRMGRAILDGDFEGPGDTDG